ncbi:hypothetical protein LUZ60_001792 [Juncus effusus]|nr:hypothetical protein LUZ60_001792 [Juncus effusus]
MDSFSMSNNGDAFLRQLSINGDHSTISSYSNKSRRGSKRWGRKKRGDNAKLGWSKVEEAGKKRVMVVIDHSYGSKNAMMWALTHVANKGDLLTLIHVLSRERERAVGDEAYSLVNTLGSICKACKPEVEVEALVIRGPKLATVLSQVKKLEVSVLVLSQYKPSPFCCWLRSSREEFVEESINRAECLTLAVRKQSKGIGGYLVSTRWQKDFWLLA